MANIRYLPKTQPNLQIELTGCFLHTADLFVREDTPVMDNAHGVPRRARVVGANSGLGNNTLFDANIDGIITGSALEESFLM
jgi:hypothetical protein